MPPLDGQVILEMHSLLALQVVTRLQNQISSKGEALVPRALTDVERITLMQFVNLVLTAFTAEWKQIYPKVDVDFGALADSVAKLPRTYLKGTALLADIELQIDGNAVGNLRFCYPPDLLYAIQSIPVLPAKSGHDATAPSPQPVSASPPDNTKLLTAIEDLLETYVQRIEQRLSLLEEKVDALSKKRRGRR
jgi:flagellar motor switch protein FliM